MNANVPSLFPLAPKEATTQPCHVVSSDFMVSLYNSTRPYISEVKTRHDRHLSKPSKTVRKWFQQTAKDAGWSQVKFYKQDDNPRMYAALLVYKHQESDTDLN